MKLSNLPPITLPANVFRILAILLSLLFISGCFYDEGLAGNAAEDTLVSYALDIQPIFNTNCTSCHPLIISKPDLSSGNSYEAILMDNYIVPKDEDSSILYQRLLGRPNVMPPSGALPQKDILLVKKWIAQGAINN